MALRVTGSAPTAKFYRDIYPRSIAQDGLRCISTLPADSASVPALRMIKVNAVASAEVQQWCAFKYLNLVDLAHEDGVIAGGMCLHHFAVKVGECSRDHGCATTHFVVVDVEAARSIGVAFRIREEFRERLLVFAKDTDPKTAPLAKMKISLSKMIDTNQNQRWPQRNRT